MSSSPKQTGDKHREFVGLITKHQAAMRAYIISLMPGIPGASDVLQNTNLILWEKRKSFEHGSNFVAWAFTIARFEVKNHKRKIRRQQPILELQEEVAVDLAEYCKLSPEDTESRIGALERCLSKLRPFDRELVKSHYASDITLTGYAEQIDRPVGSLRVSLHRIRAGLRKCIEFQLSNSNLTR